MDDLSDAGQLPQGAGRDGRGAYEQVNADNFASSGELDAVVAPQAWRPRIVLLCMLVVVTAVVAMVMKTSSRLAKSTAEASDKLDLQRLPPHMPPGARLRYTCALSEEHTALLSSAIARPTLGAVLGARLLEAVWAVVDSDADGWVGRGDVAASQDFGHLSKQAAELLLAADFGEAGHIGHKDFVSAMTGSDIEDQPDDRRRLFDGYAGAAWLVLDTNGDGRVSRRELGTIEWYRDLPKEAAKALYGADVNADGSLSKREFLEALQRSVRDSPDDDDDLVANAVAAEIQSWSSGKRAWCCAEAGIGCVSAPAAPSAEASQASPTTTPPRFDCLAGYGHWRESWSAHKQLWCCDRFGRGCGEAAEVATSSPYDCAEKYDTWERSWSLAKREWCCRHSGRGCAGERRFPRDAEVATASDVGAAVSIAPGELAFNCRSSDAGNFPQAWSLRKQAWCCAREGVACASV